MLGQHSRQRKQNVQQLRGTKSKEFDVAKGGMQAYIKEKTI